MTELCVLFVVKTGGVFAVESANVIALGQNILVVQITDKLRFFFIANQTSSPTSKRFVVTDIINQSWININLLSQICTFTYKFRSEERRVGKESRLRGWPWTYWK